MLCAVICCGLFSVSAFAAEDEITFEGNFLFNEDFSDFPITVQLSSPFISNGEEFAIFCISKSFGGVAISYIRSDLTGIYVYENGTWVDPSYRSVYFSSFTMPSDFYNIFLQYGNIINTIGYSDFSSVTEQLISQLNLPLIVAVLVGCVTVGIGFVFMWWGARYASRSIITKLKFKYGKGKLMM